MDFASETVGTALRLPALIISLSCHEFAHAWTANRLGDDTARKEGRLTLNPLAHLSLVGTLFMHNRLRFLARRYIAHVDIRPRIDTCYFVPLCCICDWFSLLVHDSNSWQR